MFFVPRTLFALNVIAETGKATGKTYIMQLKGNQNEYKLTISLALNFVKNILGKVPVNNIHSIDLVVF